MTVVSKFGTIVLGALAVALISTTAMAERRGDRGEGRMGGEPFMALDFAALDADKDGKVTPAEIETARTARITQADTNKDGFLSSDELQAMAMTSMQERMKEGATDMAAKMIERQDTDGDGKLSVAELAPKTGQEKMFSRVDTDKDGALSEAELAAAKARMAERRDGGKKGRHGGDKGQNNGQGNN